MQPTSYWLDIGMMQHCMLRTRCDDAVGSGGSHTTWDNSIRAIAEDTVTFMHIVALHIGP